MLRVYGCITAQHDLRLVLIAALICLFACFTAFSLLERAATTKGRFHYAWLATVALVTGCGVWTTHFVAMLAFQPGLPVAYNVGLTALSVLIAISLSGAGFFVSLDWNRPLLGGAIVGLAIASMHFVGMAALDIPAQKHWDSTYVTASLLIGLSFSAAALAVWQRIHHWCGRSFSVGLLVLGICGMHFVAMTALSFAPDPLIEIPKQTIQSGFLVIGVALLIVGIGLIGSIVDQSLARRATFEAERLRQHVTELESTTNALRDSEERIRGIAENLPGFLFQCLVEADGGIRFKVIGSSRFEFATGAKEQLQNHAEVTLDIVTKEDRPNLEKAILAGHGGGSNWEHTFRVNASDGSWRSVRAISRLTQRAQSESLWDGIALDETDRIATEAQNAKLEVKLRQAEKMEAIGTLAGGVAHELNNLLQPIIMMTELVLAELPKDSRHISQLDRVIDAGTKAAEIVQRILAFGRADEVSHNLLDMGFVAREAIAFIRTILPSSITLHVDIDDSVGSVRGDKTQLTQVLINLATNARDAIGASVGTVWVSLSKSSVRIEVPVSGVGTLKPGAYAILTIRDTGAGMDKATVQRIFEPFFTTKGVGKGTGLGLSVTHGIIAGHGGAIQVDSAPGRGTSLSIYLPIEETDVALALTG